MNAVNFTGGLAMMAFFVYLVISIVSAFKRNGKFKKNILITVILLAAGMSLGYVANKIPENAGSKPATAKITDKEEQKKVYQNFEKSVLELAAKIYESEDNFVDFQNQFIKNPSVTPEAYQYVKSYKDVLNAFRKKIQSIEVPAGLPDEWVALLKGGLADMQSGVSMKSIAVDSLLSYMDNKKVSDLASFKENAPLYIAGVKSGLEKINEVKKAVE